MATGTGDPFKMTTVALLVVAVVMALLFTTKSMDREVEDQDRIEAAAAEVEAVDLFLADGDIPGAVVALHDVGMRLAPVEGAEEAATRISAAVTDALAAHASTRSELEKARRETGRIRGSLADVNGKLSHRENRSMAAEMLRDRNALAVANLAKGRVELARQVIEGAEEPDVVTEAVRELVARVEKLNRLAGVVGTERVEALRSVARAWPLSGLAAVARDLDELARRSATARTALGSAAERLDSGDTAGARESLSLALRQFGLAAVPDLVDEITRRELMHNIETLREKGDLMGAAAGLRVLGDMKEAMILEGRAVNVVVIGEILRVAREKSTEAKLFLAAELLKAAGEMGNEQKLIEEAERTRSAAYLARADESMKLGQPESALRDASMALPRMGERAEQLVKLAAEALADTQRSEKMAAARAALFSGNGEAALRLLESLGGDIDGKADLVARANLLAGDIEKGLAGLPKDAELKTVRLINAAWAVLEKDPIRSARLGLASVDSTGDRPGTLALLTATLGAAGDTPTDPIWEKVRKLVFDAAALPGEK